MESFLTPSQNYEPGRADREQWCFRWSERELDDDRVHHIELPFGRRMSGVLLRPASSNRLVPSTTPTAAERGSLFVVEDNGEGQSSGVNSTRLLALFLLAVFRRRKYDEVADLIADGGHGKLGSAHYLQYLSFHLSLAEDRFLHDAPVPGVTGRARWERWSEALELEQRRAEVAPAVTRLREDYFRGRSLRLIARVTSTFWFLFRWILVPFLLVKVALLVGAAVVIALAGLLILSLFATTAVWLARRLHGKLQSEPSARGKLRRDGIFWAGVLELIGIAVAAALWPEMRRYLLPMTAVFLATLVGAGAFGTLLLRGRLRRDTFARFFERETVPFVSLLILGLAVIVLLIVIGTVLQTHGPDVLKFRPTFDAVQEAVRGGEE